MKKYYFKLRTFSGYDFKNEMIRKNKDIVLMLLEAIQLINISKYSTDDIDCSDKLILYVDKMSRIFFSHEDKIISFHFPFIIEEYDEQRIKLFVPYRNEEFDSHIVSLVKSIFLTDIDYSKSLEELLEMIWNKLAEDTIDKDVSDFVLTVVHHLMVTDYGYLRYDHDIEHENGLLHPEHHLDINYSSNSTYKIGLDSSIDSDYFIDLLNSRTNAKFLCDKK